MGKLRYSGNQKPFSFHDTARRRGELHPLPPLPGEITHADSSEAVNTGDSTIVHLIFSALDHSL